MKKVLFIIALCAGLCISHDAVSAPDMYNIYSFYENGKWGLKYDDCTFVHPQYDDAARKSTYGEAQLTAVCRDGRWFLVDSENRPLFRRTFDDLKTMSGIYHRRVLKKEYKETTASGYSRKYFREKDYVETMDTVLHGTTVNLLGDHYYLAFYEFKKAHGWYPVLMGAMENGKWGYVDGLGDWVIAPDFDDAGIRLYRHKKAPLISFLKVRRDGKWMLIDLFGTIVYESEKEPKIDPWGAVKSKIDTDALTKKRAEYENLYDKLVQASETAAMLAGKSCPERPGVVPVKNEDGLWGLKDTVSGAMVAPFKYYTMFDTDKAFGAYRVTIKGKYGIVNVVAGEVIPCVFDYISPFDENGNAESSKGSFTGKVNVYGFNGLEKGLMREKKYKDLLDLNANNYYALWHLANTTSNSGEAEKYYCAAREVCKSRYDEPAVQDMYGRIAYDLGESRAISQEAESSETLVSVFSILSGIVDVGTQLYAAYNGIDDSGAAGASSAVTGSETDGGDYASRYAMWERRAKANYESLTNLGYSVKKKDGSESGSAAGSMNTGNYVNMKKALREAQDEMAKIRRSASGAGVNIPQSKWETVTVTY